MVRRFFSACVIWVASYVCLAQAPTMRVHAIDVGQGSATLVEFKCGAILVDSGGGAAENTTHLIDYLTKFFRNRTDLKNTLSALILTHCHKDHARGLAEVAKKFTVKRYIYNTFTTGSGASDQRKFFRVLNSKPGTKVVGVTDRMIAARGDAGYTDTDIDPLQCGDCDPLVRVLGGRQESEDGEYKNQNNHSVIVRFDLGGSSLLITGDAETKQLEHVRSRFSSSSLLDTDIYLAGHHGSKNATSRALLADITPRIALVSCGKWTDGQSSQSSFNTWSYGHPNRSVIEALEAFIGLPRTPKDVKVGLKKRTFVDYRVTKAVYCTGWDRDIILEASETGTLKRVSR